MNNEAMNNEAMNKGYIDVEEQRHSVKSCGSLCLGVSAFNI